jgi:hypothetical protein
VQVLSRWSIQITEADTNAPQAYFALQTAFVALPPGRTLEQLTAVDLPLTGRVAVGAAELATNLVAPMPYVGEVELIDTLDTSNVAISGTKQGLIIRGNVRGGPAPELGSGAGPGAGEGAGGQGHTCTDPMRAQRACWLQQRFVGPRPVHR